MKILGPWKMSFLTLFSTSNKRAHKHAPDNSIIVVFRQFHVKTNWQDKFLEILSEYTFSSLKATGNIMAEAYYENGDSSTMWLVERWGNRICYDNNEKSVAAEVVDALAKIGLESPVETFFIKDLEFFSKEVRQNDSRTNDQPLTIMLFIDVKVGAENHFRSLNHDAMLALRNEPGVLHFQFGQFYYHKSRFIVYKKFRDWDTFQYHLKDPALEPLMKFLKTSINQPPFEKGYHQLIQFAPQ